MSGYVHHYIFGNTSKATSTKNSFMQFIRDDLKEDPPKYVRTLVECSQNASEFFYLALGEEGLDNSVLQDDAFLRIVTQDILKRIGIWRIPIICQLIELLRHGTKLDVVHDELLRLGNDVGIRDSMPGTNIPEMPRSYAANIASFLTASVSKIFGYFWTSYNGIISYQDPENYLYCLRNDTCFKETSNFVSLIKLVHDFPGSLCQFIAVYGPSFMGKTQLAYAVDRFSEFPLLHDENGASTLREKPLSVCLRIACESSMSENSDRGANQAINSDIFTKSLYEAVKRDCAFVDQKTGLQNDTDDSMSSSYSVGSLYDHFLYNPSSLIGFLVGWIAKRKNGDESRALKSSEQSLCFSYKPKSIIEVRREFQIHKPSIKPYVVILDEYSLSQSQPSKKKSLLYLRNILRACGFVVVLMGTNSSALNMPKKSAIGSIDSGVAGALWAQIVVNIFSPPTDDIGRFFQNHSSRVAIQPILKWIENTNCCIRPGLLQEFLSSLQQSSSRSTIKVLDESLDFLHNCIVERKQTYATFQWLIGQVRALLSGVCQNNYAQSHFKSIGISRYVESTLVNTHYAYLNSHSKDPRIPLFGLYRRWKAKKLRLEPVGWECDSSNNDIILDHHAAREACKKNAYKTCESSTQSLKIDNYLEKFDVVAPCISNFTDNSNEYIPGCGFPLFEQDELGFLGLFHSKNPFAFVEDLLDVARSKDDIGLFADLNDKLASEDEDLTTRAAFTLTFRYICGKVSVDDHTAQGGSKSGSFLEIVSHAAFVIASYKFGLGGSLFSEFLPRFIAELSFKKWTNLKLSEKSIRLLGFLAKCRMPFFPLVHTTCSKDLTSIAGVHSGTLKMCKNSDKIDGIGYADCLADLKLFSRALFDLLFSNEEKNFKIGFKTILSCTMKAIENQNVVLGRTKGITENSIKSLLPKLRKPSHHVHFIITEAITSMTSDSKDKLRKSFENVTFIVAAAKNSENVIELEDLFDYEAPENSEAGEDNGEELYENIKPVTAKTPTTILIIPFMTLFPDDGPMRFTCPEAINPKKRGPVYDSGSSKATKLIKK